MTIDTSIKILLVEDVGTMRKMEAKILGQVGFTQTGIIVDSVSEVVNVKDDQVEDVPSFGTGMDQTMILGLAKLKEGVTILLDIDRLMNTREVVAPDAIEEMV